MSEFNIKAINSWPNLRADYLKLRKKLESIIGDIDESPDVPSANMTKNDLVLYSMRMASGEEFIASGYKLEYVKQDNYSNKWYRLVPTTDSWNTIIIRCEYPFSYYVSIALTMNIALLQSGSLAIATDITQKEFVPLSVSDGSLVEDLFTNGIYTPTERTEYLIFSYDSAENDVPSGASDSEDALAYKYGYVDSGGEEINSLLRARYISAY